MKGALQRSNVCALLAAVAQLERDGGPSPRLRGSALEPDAITYNASASGLGKAAQWRCALRLVGAARESGSLEPDLYTHNALLAACEQGHVWRQAAVRVALLAWEGFQGDVLSYSSSLSACGKSSSWGAAVCLLAHALRTAVRVNLISCDSAMTACGALSAVAKECQSSGRARRVSQA